jgi:TRAP-type mannitol/chloroaromatic compound transport system permease small subunit
MLGSTIVALGWAYVHRHDRHVRVDVFYTRLSARGKAIVDTLCAFLLFFPLILALAYGAGGWMWLSWSMKERLMEGHWYPPAGPIRTVIFLGLCLFALQGVAELIRDLYLLIRKKPL